MEDLIEAHKFSNPKLKENIINEKNIGVDHVSV